METFAFIILISGAMVGAGLLLGLVGACIYFFDQEWYIRRVGETEPLLRYEYRRVVFPRLKKSVISHQLLRFSPILPYFYIHTARYF